MGKSWIWVFVATVVVGGLVAGHQLAALMEVHGPFVAAVGYAARSDSSLARRPILLQSSHDPASCIGQCAKW